MPTLPNETRFDASHEHPQSAPGGPEAQNGAQGLHLVLPAAALVVTLGLFGYALSTGTRSDSTADQLAASAPQSGDFSPQEGWIKNFEARLNVFGYAPARYSGTGYRFASLPPTDLPIFVEAALTNTGPAGTQLAVSKPAAEQSGNAQVVASAESALDSLSVEFKANSARIPSRDSKIIRRAAEAIKALPAGTAVELVGYTGGTATSPRTEALAKARANSVYKALLRAGVDRGILRPVGDGSATIEARSGSQMEGRSSTASSRRVEFRVARPLP